VTVGANTATQIITTGPASATAGSAFSITVQALDAAGNVSTGYRGTVVFSSSDPGAVLPNPPSLSYPFTATDAGKHTFSGLVLKKAVARRCRRRTRRSSRTQPPSRSRRRLPPASPSLVPSSATAGTRSPPRSKRAIRSATSPPATRARSHSERTRCPGGTRSSGASCVRFQANRARVAGGEVAERIARLERGGERGAGRRAGGTEVKARLEAAAGVTAMVAGFATSAASFACTVWLPAFLQHQRRRCACRHRWR